MDVYKLNGLLLKHEKIRNAIKKLDQKLYSLEADIIRAKLDDGIEFDGTSVKISWMDGKGTLTGIEFTNHTPVIKYQMNNGITLSTWGYPNLLDEYHLPINNESYE